MSITSSGQISVSDINTELGRRSDDTYSFKLGEGGTYGAINPHSVDRPNGTSPFSLREWYNYDHDAAPTDYFANSLNVGNQELVARYDTSLYASYPGSGTSISDEGHGSGSATVKNSPPFTDNVANPNLPSYFTMNGSSHCISITNSVRQHAYLTYGYGGNPGLGGRKYYAYQRLILWVYIPSSRSGTIYNDVNYKVYVNSSGRLVVTFKYGYIYGTGIYTSRPSVYSFMGTTFTKDCFVTCPRDQWIMVDCSNTNYVYRYRSGRRTYSRNYPQYILKVYKADGTTDTNTQSGSPSTAHSVPINHTPASGDLMTETVYGTTTYMAGRIGAMFIIRPTDGMWYSNSSRTTSGSGHSASYCDGGGGDTFYADTKTIYGH